MFCFVMILILWGRLMWQSFTWDMGPALKLTLLLAENEMPQGWCEWLNKKLFSKAHTDLPPLIWICSMENLHWSHLSQSGLQLYLASYHSIGRLLARSWMSFRGVGKGKQKNPSGSKVLPNDADLTMIQQAFPSIACRHLACIFYRRKVIAGGNSWTFWNE